jgi:hypothetical protein
MKRSIYAAVASVIAAATLALSMSVPSNGFPLAEDKGPTVVTPSQQR